MWGIKNRGAATRTAMWAAAIVGGLGDFLITGEWWRLPLYVLGGAMTLTNKHSVKTHEQRLHAAEAAAAVEGYMKGREHLVAETAADVIPIRHHK